MLDKKKICMHCKVHTHKHQSTGFDFTNNNIRYKTYIFFQVFNRKKNIQYIVLYKIYNTEK